MGNHSKITALCLMGPALVSISLAGTSSDPLSALGNFGSNGAEIKREISEFQESRKTSSNEKKDIFSLNSQKVPQYIQEEIAKNAKNKTDENIYSLKREILNAQEKVEYRYNATGQTCQAVIETNIQDYKKYNSIAESELTGIHSTQVSLLEDLRKQIIATKAQSTGIWAKLESDRDLFEKIYARVGSLDEIYHTMITQDSRLLENTFQSTIQQTRQKTIQLIQEKNLKVDRGSSQQGPIKLSLRYNSSNQGLFLEATTDYYPLESQEQLIRWSSEDNTIKKFPLFYNFTIAIGLESGEVQGATLKEALSVGGRNPSVLGESEKDYVSEENSAALCIDIAGTQLALQNQEK